MDENLEGVKDTAVEPEVESPTTQETPTTTEDKPEEVNSTEETEAVEESEVKESGKTANTRIRELVKENKSLAEKVAELTGSVDPSGQLPQYKPQFEPGAEITAEQYQADVMARADALVQLRLKQQQTLDRVNRESQEAIAQHKKLDPNSDEFDKDLSESITEATLAFVKANPASSVKKFVDSLMKPYERSLDKSEGEAQAKMAKQVAQAALKPTQVKAEEKPFESLSIKEMERKLGLTQT